MRWGAISYLLLLYYFEADHYPAHLLGKRPFSYLLATSIPPPEHVYQLQVLNLPEDHLLEGLPE